MLTRRTVAGKGTRPRRSAQARLGPLLSAAQGIAHKVGRAIARRVHDVGRVRRKGPGDFVTDVDVWAEEQVMAAIARQFPGHNRLGEESGLIDRGSAFTWVVDPIDGTSNFARGLRCCALALACLDERLEPVVAAVFALPDQELLWASRGGGAFGQAGPLRAPHRVPDDAAIVALQWVRGASTPGFLPRLSATGCRLRNFGCTVLHMCDVARGRLDANVQTQGHIWDLAAAGLIAEEAGARVVGWDGRRLMPFADLNGDAHYPSITAPPFLARRLAALVAEADVSDS